MPDLVLLPSTPNAGAHPGPPSLLSGTTSPLRPLSAEPLCGPSLEPPTPNGLPVPVVRASLCPSFLRALGAPLAQRPGAIAGWRAGRAQLTWAGCREQRASPDAERSRQAWVGLLCRHILTARARPAPPRLPLTLPSPIPSQGDSPSLARLLVGPVSP